MTKGAVGILLAMIGVVFFASAQSVHAASSRLYLYEEVITTEIDEESGEEYEVYDTITTLVEDGGTYPVNLEQLYQLGLESDVEVDHNPAYGYTIGYKGKLYRINSSSGERELVTNVFGPDGAWELTWGTAGEYEFDVYAFEEAVPILSEGPWWERLFAFLVPVAYAEGGDYEELVETIHFIITDENALPECCSAVLFLPGIKGSILAKDDLIGDDVLWPPTIWSNDVSQLALTGEGESINDVFVKGILEEVSIGPKTVQLYAPFASFMDGLVADGTIAEWKPLPYDWRFSPEKILEDGIQTEGEVLDVLAEVEELASHSATGQVTIIAHSMGGLMGKAIIKKLEEEGKDDLIDAFVMVGSPQLGTPQTITSLLHGHGEGIPNDFDGYRSFLNNSVADPATTREVAQKMPSSYNLLPSPEYFDEVSDPVVLFNEDETYTEAWRQAWGPSIDSYAEFVSFLTAQGAGRSNPDTGDLLSPEILSAQFVQHAEDFHSVYDTYSLPEHIRVVELAGWGMPTVKSVEYVEEHEKQSYEPIFTSEGDGTVVYPSAVFIDSDDKYYLNLDLYRNANGTQAKHKDLMGTSPIQELITHMLKEQPIETSEFITSTKPSTLNIEEQLLVSAHSPVILGAYDEEGRYTGIDTDAEEIREEIPGSSFRIFGTSQYIFLPEEGEYDFVYEGIGTGSTTIKIATFSDDEVVPIVAYSDIPTTGETTAEFEINSEAPEETTIVLDQNGDGTPEEEITPDGTQPEELSLEQLTALLKDKINDSDLRKTLKRQLLRVVRAFERTQQSKIRFLRTLLGRGALRVVEVEIRALERRHRLSAAQAAEFEEILVKINEKI